MKVSVAQAWLAVIGLALANLAFLMGHVESSAVLFFLGGLNMVLAGWNGKRGR